MKLSTSGFVAALTTCFSVLVSAHAQETVNVVTPERDTRGTFTFVWENDWFGDQDRNYTNGLRLGWLSSAKKLRGIDASVADVLTSGTPKRVRRGFAIGHSVYTPNNIETSEFLPDEHPYAGYLYIEGTSLIETENTQDQASIRLGLVGPSTGARWIQTEYHKLIGAKDPKGWNNQIRDEAGIDLIWDRRYRALATFGSTDFGADVIPSVGVTLGTLHTDARAGLTIRAGQDLKNDFGPPRVSPSLAGAGYFDPDDSFSWYIFGGAEARYVAHNIILGGSLFHDDDEPTVSMRNGVLDLQAGIVAQFRSYQLGLTYVERTKEFEEQKLPQRFGAVSISMKY